MKKTPLLFFFLFALFSQNYLSAQDEKRANVWYFSNKSGIDFNTNPPSPLTDGELVTYEGSATICDTLGRLLIYTDGEKIWNRTHEVMEGGDNLAGHISTTQSSIIIPLPDSPNILYVFYLNETKIELPFDERGQLYFAVVDMTMNNGLGGIVSVNNFLYTDCAEKLTAIRHCNRKDFWVIAHENGTNNFLLWQLTEFGLSSAPKIISIGSIPKPLSGYATGYMKGSPLGDKLALGIYSGQAVELFSFDKETGLISNPILFNDLRFRRPYGIAFSPNGKKLYVTNFLDKLLLQINLDLPTAAEIKASTVVIANTDREHGAIQNAPDGKLYLSPKFPAKLLSIIQQPNELGVACDFTQETFFAGENYSGIGLPNFPSIYFRERDTIEAIEITENCEGMKELNAITNVAGDSVVYQWYNENNLIPNSNSTKLEVEVNGMYEFKALVYNNCKTVLKEYTKTIDAAFEDIIPLSMNIEKTDASCNESNGTINIIGDGGMGQLEYKLDTNAFQNSKLYTDLAAGLYNISIKDERECMLNQDIAIEEFSIPRFISISTQPTLCEEATGSIIIEVDGGFGALNVRMNDYELGEGLKEVNLEAGDYDLQLSDELGCTIDTTATIESLNCPFYIPNVFSPNGDGINDYFEIEEHPGFEGTFKLLKIYNRWGNLVYEVKNFDKSPNGWNGEFQGQKLPEGVYLFYLEFNYLESPEEVITGMISLVK